MLQGHLISLFALVQFLITDHEILVKECPKTMSLGELQKHKNLFVQRNVKSLVEPDYQRQPELLMLIH